MDINLLLGVNMLGFLLVFVNYILECLLVHGVNKDIKVILRVKLKLVKYSNLYIVSILLQFLNIFLFKNILLFKIFVLLSLNFNPILNLLLRLILCVPSKQIVQLDFKKIFLLLNLLNDAFNISKLIHIALNCLKCFPQLVH